jgi:hypothetical protein
MRLCAVICVVMFSCLTNIVGALGTPEYGLLSRLRGQSKSAECEKLHRRDQIKAGCGER